jgi:hypothetical protein
MRTAPAYRIETKEVRNPEVQLSTADAAVFHRLHEGRLAQVGREHATARAARPSQHIRDYNHARNAVMKEAIPNFASSRQKLLDIYAEHFGKVREQGLNLQFAGDGIAFDHIIDELAPVPRPRQGVGEFWWASTSMWSTMDEFTVDLPDQKVRIYGHLRWEGDEFIPGSFGYSESFVLSPDRFPANTGVYEISTRMRVEGLVSGFTGFYDSLWAADDKWCKCWENRRITVSLGSGTVLESRPFRNQIIDLDDAGPIGQASYEITADQGEVMTVPLNLAALAASGTSILLQVERWYDVQLEGDADIWFRYYRGVSREAPVPGPDNAVLCQTAPTFLYPI